MLNIRNLILGPVQTNCYMLWDSKTDKCVIIDPAWDGAEIFKTAEKEGLKITGLWYTHAHFDHLGGVADLCAKLSPQPKIALHADDLPLWKAQGAAPLFGMQIDLGPEPDTMITHGQKMQIGEYEFEVRHTPGHTPGHVIYYCQTEAVVFCGDVIFQGSIGRTDLPGSDYQILIESINTHILSLPDETHLLTGHGPETSVGEERLYNPFLS